MERQALSSSSPGGEPFSLPTTGTRGRGWGIALEWDAVAWTSHDEPCRRAFNEIASIHLSFDPPGDNPAATCTIRFIDGERLKVDVDYDPAHTSQIDSYLLFVPAFFYALGPEHRSRIEFVFGANPIARMIEILMIVGAIVAFIATMIWSLATGDYLQDNGWLLFPLIILFILLMSAMLHFTLKSRRTRFDPLEIPKGLMPMPMPIARRNEPLTRGRPDKLE